MIIIDLSDIVLVYLLTDFPSISISNIEYNTAKITINIV